MYSKVGSFSLNTSTGNQAVTGLGFTPKFIFFYVTDVTSNTNTSGWMQSWGGTDGTRQYSVISIGSSITTHPDERAMFSTKCIVGVDPGTYNYTVQAGISSFDSDGFTINISLVSSSPAAAAYKVGYWAIGGSDITAYTNFFGGSGATGNQSITTPGFKPDVIIMNGYNGLSPNAVGPQAALSMGFGTSSTNRAALGHTGDYQVDPTHEQTMQRTDRVQTFASTNTPSVEIAAFDLVSFDTNGFTINWQQADSVSVVNQYVVIKGGLWKVGSFNTTTSTGNQGVTGVGFNPDTVLFASFMAAATTSPVADSRIGVGAADGTNQFATGAYNIDAQSPMVNQQWFDDSLAYKNLSSSNTVQGAFSYVSTDTDGFTVNQSTGDTGTNQVIYLAAGSSARTVGTLFDAVGHTESVTVSISGRNPPLRTEVSTVTEAVTMQMNPVVLLPSDTSAVTESVTVAIQLTVNKFDSSAVTEGTMTVQENENINSSDSSSVTDVLSTLNAPLVHPVAIENPPIYGRLKLTE